MGMPDDGLYDVVTTKIDEAVTTVGTFYGHVETYHRLRGADGTGEDVLQRSAERVIESWLAAEQDRRDVDWLIHELQPTFRVRVSDEATGEEHVETWTADTVAQALHHTQADLTNLTDIDPPSRYSEGQVEELMAAVEDRYDDLANMNRQYLQALQTLTAYEPVAEDKFARTTFDATPVDEEYAQIESVMQRRIDDTPA